MGFRLSLLRSLDGLCARVLEGRSRFALISLVFLTAMVVCGWISVRLGPFDTYDLRNYQFYSPHALLNGRFAIDHAAAQIQTFLNPLPLVPFYLAVTNLEPVVAGFVMGAVHGANVGLLFLVALRVLQALGPAARVMGAVGATAMGAYGPTFVGMMGGSGSDNVTCLFILAGLYGLLRGLQDDSRAWIIAGGIMIGGGAGLKLVALVFVLASAVALLAVGRIASGRWAGVAWFGAAAGVGLLATRGFWMVHLWSRYDSPLFPFYNALFRSPYFHPANFSDPSFLPDSLVQALLMPFAFFRDPEFMRMAHHIRDIRYGVMAVLLLGLVGTWIFHWGHRSRPERLDRPSAFLLVFFVVAYVLWQAKFAVPRYVVALELLAPLLILVTIRVLVRPPALQVGVVVVLFAAMALTTKTRQTERMDWAETYVRVEAPTLENPEETMVLIANEAPWSYLIPFFPPEVQFVGIWNTFSRPRNGSSHRAAQEMSDLVEAHRGPLYLLSRSDLLQDARSHVVGYDLMGRHQGRLPVASQHEKIPLYLWPLRAR